MLVPFQLFRNRHESWKVLFYPFGKCRICLTFRRSPANSALDGGAHWRRFSR
jgi:hypothetical protein